MNMYGWSVSVAAKPRRPGQGLRSAVPVSHGVVAGTRVASNFGWRTAEALTVGDKVLTFDNGVQPIVDIQRTTIWADGTEVAPGFWPVVIPSGALGNAQEVTLLPDQGVMLESDAASDPLGDPFAVVPAQALEGLCGIHRSAPQHAVELISFFFARDEVIYLDGGLLIHCPRSLMMLQDMMAPSEVLYDVISVAQAREILTDNDVARQALVQSGGYVFGATEMVLVA